jgi:hypothetical protein
MAQVDEQRPEAIHQGNRFFELLRLLFLELSESAAVSVEAFRSAIEAVGNAMEDLCKFFGLIENLEF